jgi:Domain of unknown function (DUF4365)
MASSIRGPRKQRTRQHVIADLSVHHVEGFILEEGHTAQRFGSDYGYDLVMHTFDEDGFAEPGSVNFQVKASESLQVIQAEFVFDMDIRDYNLWIDENGPVILILFDVARKEAFWLAVQSYFDEDAARCPSKGAKSVRVRVSPKQIVTREAVKVFRGLMQRFRKPRLRVHR